ncbi:MAG: hypothetical protein KDK11_01545, partial [Maritimibacter sp.]|nr:hypothetical protein [Maritimibacter sp.]
GGPVPEAMVSETVADALKDIRVRDGSTVMVFGPDGALLGKTASRSTTPLPPVIGVAREQGATL